jgi:hypothetical protein
MVNSKVTEELLAIMRQLRLDDPEAYRAVLVLIRRVGGRVERSSSNRLTKVRE